MIGDEGRLGEVLEEIAEWDLAKRRRYISQIETANGTTAAEQLRKGLKWMWEAKNRG